MVNISFNFKRHIFRLEINDIGGAEHTGTHIDAPSHFAKGEWTVAQIPLDHFFGPGN